MQGGKVVVLVVWGFFDKHTEHLLSARLRWVLCAGFSALSASPCLVRIKQGSLLSTIGVLFKMGAVAHRREVIRLRTHSQKAAEPGFRPGLKDLRAQAFKHNAVLTTWMVTKGLPSC